MAGKEEKDGVERVAANRTDFFLCDFSKCERRAALEINIVGKGKCGQRGKWWAAEEVGCRPVLKERVSISGVPREEEEGGRTLEVLKEVSHSLSLIL
jgi:hypothetical protein